MVERWEDTADYYPEGDIYQCVWLRNGRTLRWEDHLTERGALDALGAPRAPTE